MLIKPINILQINQLENVQRFQQTNPVVQDASNERTMELSDFNVGRAILAQNNIAFRNLSTPIEVTDRYNKKVEGKDHLDLPNIHVYEYPDTNLQVFIDENQNKQNDNLIELRLYINNQNTSSGYCSLIKNNLCKRIINSMFGKNATVADNADGFYTVIAKTNLNNNNFFGFLNNIVTAPQFNEQQLQEEKQKLINYIKNKDYSNDSAFLLLNNNVRSKEECIEEIKNIKVEDLKSYYNSVIKNSDVTYYITLNKNTVDKLSKNKLLKEINDNIYVKFQKKNSNADNKTPTLNTFSTIYVEDKKVNGIEFDYPYQAKNLKDDITAYFATLMLIFLAEPHYEIKSKTDYINIPLISKSELQSYKYHNLKFSIQKPIFTNLTPERALKIHKELVRMVNDTDYNATVEDTKRIFKENLGQEINQEYIENENNNILYQYDTDIFNLYEIIDSISIDDVKAHIEKYIINQEPIVRYNNEKKE